MCQLETEWKSWGNWPSIWDQVGFPGSSAGKESACNAGDPGSIPGLGRSTREGKGYPLQYSGLENSMDCIVHGVAKSQDSTEWLSLSLRPRWAQSLLLVFPWAGDLKLRQASRGRCWWELPWTNPFCIIRPVLKSFSSSPYVSLVILILTNISRHDWKPDFSKFYPSWKYRE